MVIRIKDDELVWVSEPIFMSPKSTWDKVYDQFSPHNYSKGRTKFYKTLRSLKLW